MQEGQDAKSGFTWNLFISEKVHIWIVTFMFENCYVQPICSRKASQGVNAYCIYQMGRVYHDEAMLIQYQWAILFDM